MFKMFRRGPPRFLALSAVLLTILLCIYYVNFTSAPNLVDSPREQQMGAASALRGEQSDDNEVLREVEVTEQKPTAEPEPPSLVSSETCPLLYMAEADVDTVEQFQKFNFQVRYFHKLHSNCQRDYNVYSCQWFTKFLGNKRFCLRLWLSGNSHGFQCHE